MTKQETFDIVAHHLLDQGCRSETVYPDVSGKLVMACAYRGNLGTKCAAGVLIPDDKYDPEFEGQPIAMVSDKFDTTEKSQDAFTILTCVGRLVASLGHDTALCLRLQRLHDHAWIWEWASGLQRIANEFGLKVSSELAKKMEGWEERHMPMTRREQSSESARCVTG